MSYLKKFKRTSKKLMVFDSDEFEELDAIYVKAIKQDKKIWWITKLSKFDELQDSGNPQDIIIEFIDVINIFILLAAVLENGNPLGDYKSKQDIDLVSELPDEAKRMIVLKAAKVNKIDNKLISHLLDFIEALNSTDIDLTLDEEDTTDKND